VDYYNEIDPFCAQWLRNLMAAGAINQGVVDTRSIEDVTPDDLRGFDQCHFFAGIGVWAYALRNAGLGDRRGLWTGSCPCQPFSAAGKAGGFADERHLWPAFHHLISVCRPSIVLGEQVASKDGLTWLDLVSSDMQGSGYAFGAQDLCGAGFGAPHIRQRLWFVGLDHRVGEGLEGYAWDGDYSTRWPDAPRSASTAGGDGGVADADGKGSFSGAQREIHSRENGAGSRYGKPQRPGATRRMADSNSRQCAGIADGEGCKRDGEKAGRQQGDGIAERGWAIGELADDTFVGRREGGKDGSRGGRRDDAQGRATGRMRRSTVERLADADGRESGDSWALQSSGKHRQQPEDGSSFARMADAQGIDGGTGLCNTGSTGQRGYFDSDGGATRGLGDNGGPSWAGPTNGFWRDADWLFCRDGKWRPVEPGTFPLANGAPSRVGRLRAYGNAIIAPVAEEFCRAVGGYLEVIESGI